MKQTLGLLVILLAACGGGGGGGGKPAASPEAAIDGLLAALDRGDGDAVLAMMLPVDPGDAIDCGKPDPEAREQLKEIEADRAKQVRERAARWKGKKPTLRGKTEEARRNVTAKGDKLSDTCTAKVEVVDLGLDAELDYGAEGDRNHHPVRIDLMALGGRWYLANLSEDPWDPIR
jgi:hypothetical protein